MAHVFVVTDGVQFLDWDNKGPMSTGNPLWTGIAHARKYAMLSAAEKDARAVKAYEKFPVWVQRVNLVPLEKVEVFLVEEDPEWKEYERLKAKFRGK